MRIGVSLFEPWVIKNKKGEQDFLNFLNAWITARDAEGWLSAKHKYWFESLDWKKQ